jgi:hypothetical protein
VLRSKAYTRVKLKLALGEPQSQRGPVAVPIAEIRHRRVEVEGEAGRATMEKR